MQYQTHLWRGQPDDEAIKLLRYYAGYAAELDPRGYCVATSEGKDSRVLGHLMRRAGVPHFYLHNITGIDPPELVYFQRRNFAQYKEAGYLTYDVMYDKSLWRLMQQKLIPPMRNRRYCCEYLKERRVTEQGNALIALGVRAAESTNRARNRAELEANKGTTKQTAIKMTYDNDEHRRQFETCYKDHEQRVNPILSWSDADIWAYSKEAGLEQCSLYGEGFDRLGCIGCPMARENGRRMEFERWPEFRRLWVKSFGRMYKERVRQGKPTLERYGSCGEDWFNWWISDRAQDRPLDGQVEMDI